MEEEYSQSSQYRDEPDTNGFVVNDSVLMRKPERPYRFHQAKRLLLVYGLLSIVLGVAVLGGGIASFVIHKNFSSRFSFQIENKWTNLVLILSGTSGIALLYRNCLSFLTSTLVLSSLAIAMSFTTAVVHVVNAYFRSLDVKYYQTEKIDPSLAMTSKHVMNLNIATVLVSAAGICVSALLLRFASILSAKNYQTDWGMEIDRPRRFKLSSVGLGQIVCGLLITSWWAGVQALFQGSNLDIHTLPTGEILAHGLIAVCAGYQQMMATSKGSRPPILSATILNGGSLLVAVYYCAHPMGLIYFALEHNRSAHISLAFDAKLAMCGMLAAVYMVEVILSSYSLLNLLEFVSNWRFPQFVTPNRRVFTSLATAQMVIGVLYALTEILAVSMYFMYKLDFTPAPIFVLISGIFAYVTLRMSYPPYVASTTALLGIAAATSCRDVYLFAYHSLKESTPDLIGRSTGANLTVHLLEALLALSSVGISIALMVLYTAAMSANNAISFNFASSKNIRHQFNVSLAEIVVAIVLCGIGFDHLVGKQLYLEDFGDRNVVLSVLFLISGIFGIRSRTNPHTYLSSVALHFSSFLLLWQESDRLTYLIDYYARWSAQPTLISIAMDASKLDETSLALTFVSLLIMLALYFLSGFYLLMACPTLEYCQFGPIPLTVLTQEDITNGESITTSHTEETLMQPDDTNLVGTD